MLLGFERHHIWPLGMGGPSVPANLVWVCPSTHTNTHELLRLMVGALRPLTDHELGLAEDRPVPRYAAGLARQGFGLWAAATGLVL